MDFYITEKNLDLKLREWLKEIKPFCTHHFKLKVKKSALLVIDMQRCFLEPSSPLFTCGGLAILPRIRKLVDAYRSADRPVIFTRHVHHPDLIDSGRTGEWWNNAGPFENDPASEILSDLKLQPNEKVILKHRYSSFYNTDLETILRCMGIEDLVITGVMTNVCCESTARDAFFRDFRVFFPADCNGSVSEELHKATLMNLGFAFATITTFEEIYSWLNPK